MIKAAKTLLVGMSILIATVAVSQADDVYFSVYGTPTATRLGYTQGETYAFTFVVNGDFQSVDSAYLPQIISWNDYEPTPSLWVSVGGAFAPGSSIYPSSAPNTSFAVDGSGFQVYGVDILIQEKVGAQTGLQTLNGQPIEQIFAQLTHYGFTGSETPITPGEYFAGYPGAVFSGGFLEFTTSNDFLRFNVTGVDFSVVPEPSTVALLACAAVGSWFVLRRRSISVR